MESVVTRVWTGTLRRIKSLQNTGKIPRQLKTPAAQIDYIVDLLMTAPNYKILDEEERSENGTD